MSTIETYGIFAYRVTVIRCGGLVKTVETVRDTSAAEALEAIKRWYTLAPGDIVNIQNATHPHDCLREVAERLEKESE